jgi:uncharacterized surface protein with fasciclin (FAS1) repeats
MKCHSSLLCSALLAGVAAVKAGAATSTDEKKSTINLLRKLQAATRPPKTPPPTFAATRPPRTPPPTLGAPVSAPPTTAAITTAAPVASTPQTIGQTVCSNDDFFTLCSLLEITGLYDTLNGVGTYTLFAPTNAAIDAITSITDLTDDEIMGLLMYHVAPNVLTYSDLTRIAPGDVETMIPGLAISVSTGTDREVLLNGKVKITTQDIEASNGIIQVIDEVIIPQIESPTAAPLTPAPTLKPIEVVTAAPTLKPIEVVTAAPTLKPVEVVTEAPVAQGGTMAPTSQASSKPPTTDITSNTPTLSQPSNATQTPTNPVSLIKPIGTSAPTGEKSGAFSKSGKSGSKTPKADGKSSKHSSKSGKSIQGKTGKGSKPGYHAMEDISVQEANEDVHGRLNARFRADWNDASQLRGGSSYVTIALLTAAAAWCLHR